ncbi:fimbrial biogenesis chaperone [Luteibacter sp. 9135]|uniref:fimbrial biogenesis chaperone n=1 Tax=Luteibacter sp. 9135 TaxID=1500893 RepID=UPI00055B5B24|nr:fimbria/pilus periplasmic chaperone [Luteibacter sp. 9135]
MRLIPLIVAASLFSPGLDAAVVISGTRIVFPAQQRDVAVRIQNKGEEAALVQAWIDDGDEASTPQSARSPFVMTPPVFRIDPGQGHTLRIVHAGDTLPTDHEKLYWLNVLEIPPRAEGATDQNLLQFAFRHRLKLFHRPGDLVLPVVRATEKLQWSLVREAGRPAVQVHNASPYVVSFNDVSLLADDAKVGSWSLGGGMVEPGATTRFALPDTATAGHHARVSYASINDFGALVPGQADATP